MASFDVIAKIANDWPFQQRIRAALAVAAANVYAEDVATPGHTARASYAVFVTRSAYDVVGISYVVLGNASIAAEANIDQPPDFGIPDSDLQFAVNSLWNLLSGA